jgi:hypothetical protein
MSKNSVTDRDREKWYQAERRETLYSIILDQFMEEAKNDFSGMPNHLDVKIELLDAFHMEEARSMVRCVQRLMVDDVCIYQVEAMGDFPVQARANSKERLVFYIMKYGLGQAYHYMHKLRGEEIHHTKERNFIASK